MSILNTRFGGDGKTSDGQNIEVPAAEILHQMGPLVQVVLMPLDTGNQAFVGRSKKIAPVNGYALIDTGAQSTCIDQNAAERAGLAIVDTGKIASATHSEHEVPIFAGKLDFVAFSGGVSAHRAYGANLSSQNLVALIGRDVLQKCVLIYNGLDGSFSLAV